MNTFFDKLTHGESDQDDSEPTAYAAGSRESLRGSRRGGNDAPTHLKVETDEREAREPDTHEDETEGELTVDIYDKGDSIVIQSTVAGVKPEDLDISITNDMVSIKGKRMSQDEVAHEAYYYKELFWGTFSRSVILPEEIEDDMAEAILKHGLLTIRLPKKKRGVTQKVKVKVT